MRKKQIIIIGASIVDVLAVPAGPEVFSTGSSPADQIRMSVGGDALNEAMVLSALGEEVRLFSLIGQDMAGDMILRKCRERGVLVDKSWIRTDMDTGINVVLVKENGERCFLTNPRGGLRKLKLKDIPLPFPGEAGILCFASIFVFPEIKTEQLQVIFRAAKQQGMIVCADMTKRKQNESLQDLGPALDHVDYLFPNLEEAALLTGKESAEENADLFYKAGVAHVVIKCGARGCYIKSETEEGWVDAVPIERCVDTTGAGDSFVAGFLHGISDGKSFRACAEFACRCGAKAAGTVGATEWLDLPDSQDVLQDERDGCNADPAGESH